jgi:hypothetical protein
MIVRNNYLINAFDQDIDNDSVSSDLQPKGQGHCYAERPAAMAVRRRDGGRNSLGANRPRGPSETESQGSKALHKASLRYSFAKIQATPTPCALVHCFRESGFASVLANVVFSKVGIILLVPSELGPIPHAVNETGSFKLQTFLCVMSKNISNVPSAFEVPLRGGQGTSETPLRGGQGVPFVNHLIQMASNIIHHVRPISYMTNKFSRDVNYSSSISSSITH